MGRKQRSEAELPLRYSQNSVVTLLAFLSLINALKHINICLQRQTIYKWGQIRGLVLKAQRKTLFDLTLKFKHDEISFPFFPLPDT